MQKIIRYTDGSVAFSDFHIEHFAKMFMESKDRYFVETCTWSFVDACRAIIAEDGLDMNELVIIYNEVNYYVNRYGALIDWPQIPPVSIGQLSYRILRAGGHKKRLERGME